MTRYLTIGLAAVICGMGQPSGATTIHVPDEAATIQAGIDAAAPSDTVLVSCGIYYEHDIRIEGGSHYGMLLVSECADPSCVVVDAQGLGQVMRCQDVYGPVTVQGLTFRGGQASTGGGVICWNSYVVFADCAFEENSASGGGGFYSSGGGAQLIGRIFNGNTAALGGAVFPDVSFVTCEGCTFVGNSASLYGGAVCDMGAIDRRERGWIDLEECTFASNSAGSSGGALYFANYAESVVTACTLLHNEAPTGAAVTVLDPETFVELSRSIVAFSGLEEPVDCGWSSGGATLLMSNCLVFGNAGGDSLCGLYHDNLFVDPLLCGIEEGNFTLCANSPCLPDANPWGVLIGAHDQGCGSCSHSLISSASWGAVKALFR